MLDLINNFLGYVLIVVLLSIGAWFTVRSRFVQLRFFTRMFKVLGGAFKHEENRISSFQALSLTVAGRVGAGNVAGVAVAIALGGPGAIFWMWVVGLIGMATSFFECSLGQLFKTTEDDGSYRGGPAYYIERGLGIKWMAVLVSILLLFTTLGFLAVQSYTMVTSLNDSFGFPVPVTTVFLVIILGIIIFGGLKRIVEVAEWLVPIMALGYFGIALTVIAINITDVPAVFALIIGSAFGFEPAFGGGVGAALLYGVRRGLFSNEAGLGTAPNVAAVAQVRHPVDQGMVQSLSVFIDTLVLCSCTAMIILLSGEFGGDTAAGGVTITQTALAGHVGEWGRSFVSIALVLFTFTSMIYNYYIGENCLTYFSEDNRRISMIFRWIWLAFLAWSAFQDLSVVFAWSDVTMSLVAVVNLIAVVMLFKICLRMLDDYDQQLSSGVVRPVFRTALFTDIRIDSTAWPGESAMTSTDSG
jgi:AGCS family alanine or glycine:cation symporter